MRTALRGELLKIATVRGQWIGLALAAVAMPMTSLLVAASGGLSPEDTVTSGAATGSLAGLLGFGAWAASVTAGEYSHQTMVVSLSTVPRRTVFYGAKVIAASLTAAAASLASAVLAFAVVYAVTPHSSHRVGSPATLLSVVVAAVAVTAIGVAAGVLTRSSAAAITAVVVLILLPQTAAGLLGGLQPWVVGASPGPVITQVVGNSQLDADQTYPPGTAAAVATLLAAAAGIAVVGGCALVRRDGG
ncbi:MAG: ABC transporter permease [Frankiaceae bacterium]|nr:ABC transporter permease [Frankiaceae bacterium]MBV9869281.1 ABC transporter permease [Frankiaceae bacterium]